MNFDVKRQATTGPSPVTTVHNRRSRVRRLLAVLAALPLAALAVTVVASPAQALPHFVSEIQNDGNGKCLDVRTQDNYSVQLWDCTNHTEQQWIYGDPIVVDGIPYVDIINWRNDACLEPAGGSREAAVPVVVNPCSGGDSQLWGLFYAGSPTIRVLHNKSSGLCLDLRGGTRANGALIEQYWCNGTSAQVWRETLGW